MAETLTKTEIKNELTRRIESLENRYGFDVEGRSVSVVGESPQRLIMFGRYLALFEARTQVELGLFVGGLTP